MAAEPFGALPMQDEAGAGYRPQPSLGSVCSSRGRSSWEPREPGPLGPPWHPAALAPLPGCSAAVLAPPRRTLPRQAWKHGGRLRRSCPPAELRLPPGSVLGRDGEMGGQAKAEQGNWPRAPAARFAPRCGCREARARVLACPVQGGARPGLEYRLYLNQHREPPPAAAPAWQGACVLRGSLCCRPVRTRRHSRYDTASIQLITKGGCVHPGVRGLSSSALLEPPFCVRRGL